MALLAEASELDAEVLRTVCDGIQAVVGAAGVYVAERLNGKGSEGGEGGEGGLLRYVASCTSQAFMTEQSLREAEGGVTWKTWVLPEVVDDGSGEGGGGEGGEGGGEGAPPRAPPTLPTIHVSSVLHDPAVHYYRLPRPGAFVAVPVEYGTLMHDAALPPITAEEASAGGGGGASGAAEGEGEGEGAGGAGGGGEPRIPPGNAIKRQLALCADTMGLNTDFSDAAMAALQRLGEALKAALLRTENAAYEEEYRAARAAAAGGSEAAGAAAEAERAAAAEAEAEAAAAVEALGEGAAEEYKAYSRAAASLAAARSLVDSRVSLIAEVQRRRIQPKPDALRLLQGVWYLLGYTKEQLGDQSSADPKALDWNSARKPLGADFVAALRSYDPAAVHKVTKYQSTEAVRTLTAGLTPEDLNRQSVAFGALATFLSAALEVREAAIAKRKREAEEAEAKRAADAAAAEAAAAEAAAAAAAAAGGGDGSGGGGEGDGEGKEGGEEGVVFRCVCHVACIVCPPSLPRARAGFD